MIDVCHDKYKGMVWNKHHQVMNMLEIEMIRFEWYLKYLQYGIMISSPIMIVELMFRKSVLVDSLMYIILILLIVDSNRCVAIKNALTQHINVLKQNCSKNVNHSYIVCNTTLTNMQLTAFVQNASPQDASLQNASPQDASLQNASPQNASLQNASPQNASPQNASLQNNTTKNTIKIHSDLKLQNILDAINQNCTSDTSDISTCKTNNMCYMRITTCDPHDNQHIESTGDLDKLVFSLQKGKKTKAYTMTPKKLKVAMQRTTIYHADKTFTIEYLYQTTPITTLAKKTAYLMKHPNVYGHIDKYEYLRSTYKTNVARFYERLFVNIIMMAVVVWYHIDVIHLFVELLYFFNTSPTISQMSPNNLYPTTIFWHTRLLRHILNFIYNFAAPMVISCVIHVGIYMYSVLMKNIKREL